MTLTIVDTGAALDAVLLAPEEQREEQLRNLLAPMAEQFRYFPGEVDLAQMHLLSFGCAIDRHVDETRSALARFRERGAWTRIEDALNEAIELQSAVTVGELIVSEGLADAFARQLYGADGYTPIGVPHLRDEAVFQKVVSGLGVQGMQNFTAWVHGDASATRFGAVPVGLPTGAGYAAGNRLIDAYLEATGRNAAEALHVPSAEIIRAMTGR